MILAYLGLHYVSLFTFAPLSKNPPYFKSFFSVKNFSSEFRSKYNMILAVLGGMS